MYHKSGRCVIHLSLLAALLIACGASLAPPQTLDGVWTEDFSRPGSGLVLTLAQNNTTITGTGTYSIEAGRSGTLVVAGTYVRPAVALTLTYDDSTAAHFSGTAENRDHLSGTLAYVGGSTEAARFTKQ